MLFFVVFAAKLFKTIDIQQVKLYYFQHAEYICLQFGRKGDLVVRKSFAVVVIIVVIITAGLLG